MITFEKIYGITCAVARDVVGVLVLIMFGLMWSSGNVVRKTSRGNAKVDSYGRSVIVVEFSRSMAAESYSTLPLTAKPTPIVRTTFCLVKVNACRRRSVEPKPPIDRLAYDRSHESRRTFEAGRSC